MTPVHADSPARARSNRSLYRSCKGGARLSREDVIHYVRSTVDVYVQLTRAGGRRGMSEVVLGRKF